MERVLELKGSEKIWEVSTFYRAYQTPESWGTVAIPYLTKILLERYEEDSQTEVEKWLVINHDGAFLVTITDYDYNRNQSTVSFAPTQYVRVDIQKIDLVEDQGRIVEELFEEDEED